MLATFLLAVYGLPVVWGLWALLAGLRTRVRNRSFVAVVVPLSLVAGTFAYVFQQDGWTYYTRYLRIWVAVGAVGLLAACLREGREVRHGKP